MIDDQNLERLCEIPLFSIGHNVYNMQDRNKEYLERPEQSLFKSPKFLRWIYLQAPQLEYKKK